MKYEICKVIINNGKEFYSTIAWTDVLPYAKMIITDLNILEDDKYVESRWSEATGKKVPRKYYVITEEGRKALKEIEDLWRDISCSVAMIMEDEYHE